MKNIYEFKKGKTYHLNEVYEVYEVLGIIPSDTYMQDDINDYEFNNGNDCGESLRFIETVKITVTVKVTE